MAATTSTALTTAWSQVEVITSATPRTSVEATGDVFYAFSDTEPAAGAVGHRLSSVSGLLEYGGDGTITGTLWMRARRRNGATIHTTQHDAA